MEIRDFLLPLRRYFYGGVERSPEADQRFRADSTQETNADCLAKKEVVGTGREPVNKFSPFGPDESRARVIFKRT